MKEQRIKKRVTTYFKEEDLIKMDDFCKKHNIKRTEFLERALNHFVNSIENDLNLLSLAYYSVSDCNWLRLAVDDFFYMIYGTLTIKMRILNPIKFLKKKMLNGMNILK